MTRDWSSGRTATFVNEPNTKTSRSQGVQPRRSGVSAVTAPQRPNRAAFHEPTLRPPTGRSSTVAEGADVAQGLATPSTSSQSSWAPDSAARWRRSGWPRRASSVLVLERGAPYPPGAFPRTPRGMRENFWDPATGLLGLFDLWSFSHVTAIVASGLGGGSLIYANVILRKPADTFDGVAARPRRRSSPTTTAWRTCSRPRPIPDSEPYASTPKTLAFARAAGAAGLEVERPPLAIAFAAGRGPRAGRAARTRRQPPRASAAHLPPVRRVRRGLQRGGQEHPRLQLPQRGQAGGRARSAPAARRWPSRPTPGRLRGALPPARQRARRRTASICSTRHDELDRTVTGKIVVLAAGTLRLDAPAAGQPRRPAGAEPGARAALLEQRRHALGGPRLPEPGRRRRDGAGASTRAAAR